jgi:hypothetical protein
MLNRIPSRVPVQAPLFFRPTFVGEKSWTPWSPSRSVPRFEALVLLFHFGVSHLTSNVIAAPYFCSRLRRALKIAIVGAEEYLRVFSSQLKPPTTFHFFFKILFT